MQEHRWLLRMVKASIVVTICVIVLGAYTRLSDAGLGCPDWPGCYGQLTVPSSDEELFRAELLYPNLQVEQSKAWAEMVHRYVAGGLGGLVFAISIMSLRVNKGHWKLPVGLMSLVTFQALLGMWTVTLKLMPLVVLAHLFGGFTLLSLLVIFYTRLSTTTSIPPPLKKGSLIAIIALSLLVIQIFLGGWTSSNYAALMCTSLPICQGDWVSYLDFPTAFALYQPGHENYEFGVLDYSARMTIHVSHRIGAIIATLAILIFSWTLRKCHDNYWIKQANILNVLVTTQVILGISNVVFQLPITIAVLHNLGGALLLAYMVRINYLLASCLNEHRYQSVQPISGGSHE